MKIASYIVLTLIAISASQSASAQSLTGSGRFEKITDNPSMGHRQLYEWDLFVSPGDDSIVGPFRRLGAWPNEAPRGDGSYHIDELPAGTYSVYVNQPDFFASPKVVTNVKLLDGETTSVDIDLDVDYSTYFSDSGQWTEWKSDWYQTFTAKGTAVRGVSWRMAGAEQYRGQTARITLLEDNGQTDPCQWKKLGDKVDGAIGADSDEWVRWNSGEIPIVPGKKYAVKVHIDGGMGIYKRNKDEQSYQAGQAYDENGVAQPFDLNITVFTDRGQMVTHTRQTSGPGQFDGAFSATSFGQTFKATGDSLLAVDLFAAGGEEFDVTWTVRKGGAYGPRIGPIKTTRGAYFASSTDLLGVSYNPNEVPLTPGETYYIGVSDASAFTPYTQPAENAYDDGQAYRYTLPTGRDLSMTIIERKASPTTSRPR